MKAKTFLTVLIALMVVAVSGVSHALDISFGDSQYYWGHNPSWGTQAWNTDVPNGSWNGNTMDVIGDPNITGGTAQLNDAGDLTRITFDYYAPLQTWAMLAPGNLFINLLNGPSDTTWDYVVTTMGTARSDADGIPASLAAGNYNLYNITGKAIDAKRLAGTDIAASNPSYILSGADNSGEWAGYYIRNNHPIGVKDSVLADLTASSAYFSGFPGEITDTTPWTGSSYYSFGNGLDLGTADGIIIGWGMTCANDVVYEQVNTPPGNVPEPATMLLLGLGLIGLAGYKKYRA